MSQHHQEVCQFGTVHAQCRCPADHKRKDSIECPTPMRCMETSKTLGSDRPVTVDNPAHYRVGASGVECIEIVRSLSFDLGNCIKYLWRLGNKDEDTKELKKAIWYLVDELTLAAPVHGYRRPSGLFEWSRRFETHILSLEGSSRVTSALDHLRQGVLSLQDTGHFERARHLLEQEAVSRGISREELRR